MESSSTGKHILILDDNKELLDVLQLAFTQKGFSIDLALSYNEAQAKLASTKPDVILCDIMMPDGKSGLDFAKEVRAQAATKDVFVALMTDSTNMNYIADAAMANIGLYIQKAETDPFKIADQICEKMATK
jgi:CheY-like chemotaxis protein